MKLSEMFNKALEGDQEVEQEFKQGPLYQELLAHRAKTRDALIALGTRIKQHGRIEMRVPEKAYDDPDTVAHCTDMGDPAYVEYLFSA